MRVWRNCAPSEDSSPLPCSFNPHPPSYPPLSLIHLLLFVLPFLVLVLVILLLLIFSFSSFSLSFSSPPPASNPSHTLKSRHRCCESFFVFVFVFVFVFLLRISACHQAIYCFAKRLNGATNRLEICRDRRDRRSCKIFPSCVKFWGNNANSLGNYRVTYALNE